MEEDLARKISGHPAYQQLKSNRMRFGWLLTILMLIVYYGFILLVAFGKPLLFTRIGSGVMTVGIPLGFGVIVFTILVTLVYVKRANREFDDLADQVVKGAVK